MQGQEPEANHTSYNPKGFDPRVRRLQPGENPQQYNNMLTDPMYHQQQQLTQNYLQEQRHLLETVELSNSKQAILNPLSANDYLLFLEKSRPPRKPGSSPRAIGRQAAMEWLIGKAYTIDRQPVTGMLMDQLQLDVSDFNLLTTKLLAIEEEATLNDDAESIEKSKDFMIEGRKIQRQPISWRYGIKLQDELATGKVVQCYQNLFVNFWTIDGQKITKEMMEGVTVNDVGIKLCTIIYQCLDSILF